ncbi:MAG: AAA family ATPase [Armatimonadota bacterium]|nr:AAA family ATPase [Armatimonadota bacterium]
MAALAGPVREALTEPPANFPGGPVPEGTPRRVYGTVQLPGKVTAIPGVRRAGKTTFVHQLRRERLAAGGARVLVPCLNFEDERLAGLKGTQLGFLLEEYGRRVPDAAKLGKVLWCFDEIQVVPGWERFVRRLLDSGTAEVVVTGSSAKLASAAPGLRGRRHPAGRGRAP